MDDSSASSNYPGWIADDKADTDGGFSTQWEGGQPSWRPHLQALADKSTEMGDAELCYWSFQSLPGPGMRVPENPSVSAEDVALWFENVPHDEALNFGDMAVRRMKGRVDQGGVVVWTGCSMGRTLRRGMCQANRTTSTTPGARLEDCSNDVVWNQDLMIPMAIVIFKIQGSKLDAFKSMLSTWRADPNGLSHVPQMTSELVRQRGWGAGGQIISKTVPCSQIPEKFMYQNLGDCDEMGDSKLLADEALEVWSSLCSVTKDDCPQEDTTTVPDDHGFRGSMPAAFIIAAVFTASARWLV